MVPDRSAPVLIAGAGVAGLQTARALQRRGIQTVVLEQSEDVGGVWLRNYQGYCLQVPWEMYQFAEFPYPRTAELKDYPSGHEVLEYVKAYARHFGLYRHILFSSRLVSLRRASGSSGAAPAEPPATRPGSNCGPCSTASAPAGPFLTSFAFESDCSKNDPLTGPPPAPLRGSVGSISGPAGQGTLATRGPTNPGGKSKQQQWTKHGLALATTHIAGARTDSRSRSRLQQLISRMFRSSGGSSSTSGGGLRVKSHQAMCEVAEGVLPGGSDSLGASSLSPASPTSHLPSGATSVPSSAAAASAAACASGYSSTCRGSAAQEVAGGSAAGAGSNGNTGWVAVYEDLCTGRQYTLAVSYVVLCTGLHASPFIPKIEGQALYRGLQVHSRDFTDAAVAAGKRVLVVGGGKTAADVISELTATRAAADVTLLYRRPHWPLPRHLGPVSLKALAYSRAVGSCLLPAYYAAGPGGRAAACVLTPLRKAFWVRFMSRVDGALHVRAGMGRPDRPICQDIWYSGQVLDAARWRDVMTDSKVKALQGEVARFTPVSAVLADGTELQPDIVLYATGYCPQYTFLEAAVQEALAVQHDGLYLYRHVLPPEVPGLAFVGAEVSTFNNILTSGLQAEWLAAALAGVVHVPAPPAMAADVEAQMEWRRRTMPPHKLRGGAVMLYMQPYHDQLLADMRAPTRRKRASWRRPLAECFEPYTATDYAGLFSGAGSVVQVPPPAAAAAQGVQQQAAEQQGLEAKATEAGEGEDCGGGQAAAAAPEAGGSTCRESAVANAAAAAAGAAAMAMAVETRTGSHCCVSTGQGLSLSFRASTATAGLMSNMTSGAAAQPPPQSYGLHPGRAPPQHQMSLSNAAQPSQAHATLSSFPSGHAAGLGPNSKGTALAALADSSNPMLHAASPRNMHTMQARSSAAAAVRWTGYLAGPGRDSAGGSSEASPRRQPAAGGGAGAGVTRDASAAAPSAQQPQARRGAFIPFAGPALAGGVAGSSPPPALAATTAQAAQQAHGHGIGGHGAAARGSALGLTFEEGYEEEEQEEQDGDFDEQDTLYSLDALPPALQAFRGTRSRARPHAAGAAAVASAPALQRPTRFSDGTGTVGGANGGSGAPRASAGYQAARLVGSAGNTAAAPCSGGSTPGAISACGSPRPSATGLQCGGSDAGGGGASPLGLIPGPSSPGFGRSAATVSGARARSRGVRRVFSLAALVLRRRRNSATVYDVTSSRVEPSSTAISELGYRVLPPRHVEEELLAAAAAAGKGAVRGREPPPPAARASAPTLMRHSAAHGWQRSPAAGGLLPLPHPVPRVSMPNKPHLSARPASVGSGSTDMFGGRGNPMLLPGPPAAALGGGATGGPQAAPAAARHGGMTSLPGSARSTSASSSSSSSSGVSYTPSCSTVAPPMLCAPSDGGQAAAGALLVPAPRPAAAQRSGNGYAYVYGCSSGALPAAAAAPAAPRAHAPAGMGAGGGAGSTGGTPGHAGAGGYGEQLLCNPKAAGAGAGSGAVRHARRSASFSSSGSSAPSERSSGVSYVPSCSTVAPPQLRWQ